MLAVYRGLNAMDLAQAEPHELLTLTFLALSRAPERRTALARMLGAAKTRIPRARRKAGQAPDEAPSATNLRPVLERLAKAEWLVEHDDHWMVAGDRSAAVLTFVSQHDRGMMKTAEACLIQEALHGYGPERHLIAARAALYTGDAAGFEGSLRRVNAYDRLPKSAPLPFFDVFAPAEIETVIDRLPSPLQVACLEQAFALGIEEGVPLSERLAGRVLDVDGPTGTSLQAAACTYYDLLGIDTALGPLVEARSDALSLEAMATRAMLRNDYALAQAEIQRAWAASTESGKRRKPRLEGPLAPLMTFVAAAGGPALKAIASQQLKSPAARGAAAAKYELVEAALASRGAQADLRWLRDDWTSLLQLALLVTWAEPPFPEASRKNLSESLRLSSELLARHGFGWSAAQFVSIAVSLQDPRKRARSASLLDLRVAREPWEIALDAIEAELMQVSASELASGSDERMIWQIEIVSGAWMHDPIDLPFNGGGASAIRSAPRLKMEPRLQKRRKNGWSKGRSIALRRLADQSANAPWMTAHDRRVVGTIRRHHSRYEDYYAFTEASPASLVGHPNVYWASDDDRPVEVVHGEPALVVDRQQRGLHLLMEPQPPDATTWCEQTGPYRLTVYRLTDAQRRLADQIGTGLTVPAKAEDRLQRVVSHAASLLPVHTDLLTETEGAEPMDADPRPVVEIDRLRSGIRMRIAVFPLGLNGPRMHAGLGSATLVTSIDERLVRCERDLAAEKSKLDDLRDRCPSLRRSAEIEDQVDLADVFDALEALSELRALGDDVLMVWRKGKPLSVTNECSDATLRIAVRAEAAQWFAASGSVEVDNSLVVDLRALLDALPERNGRYVPLDDSRFLALSDSLLNKLNALSAAKTDHDNEAAEGQDVALHPLVAGVVAGWAPQLKAIQIDRKAKKRLRRAQEATTLALALPPTLEAALRPYQEEGFQWLARLSHWDAGACLADDMGLGKTVQALALLLHRAELGPALVVAPTSVCSGWMHEAARFAPTLTCFVLTGAPDPASTWSPYDVVVVSYTMMTNHIDLLAEMSFATIVLDEAQAIKNAATQRAKAARRLKGAFRMATTGTPIENHLGELWSLMSFLNPGLLGTAKVFDRRFGRGLGKDERPERIEQLKSLMAPFVLRRRKREVLKDLPPRTEVVIEIEPSAEEKAFSEALRQRALERVNDRESARTSAVTLLTELTRLRQAACHPALVDPNVGLPSSKLEHLIELVRNLIDGGHRMLVFSQFVTFLSHVRKRFDEAGVRYQYLDGSTPRAERDRAVRAFQAGEADAFVISLKAGGTGLNLTAADYVIHLDPWWNPAVDEQASSRAHRMGQTRPVTVYKLITKGSIEEKVYALHGDKTRPRRAVVVRRRSL